MPDEKSTVKEGEFKGRPVLMFYLPGHNTPLLTFGAAKAHLLMDHIEAVQDFCKQHPREGNRRN